VETSEQQRRPAVGQFAKTLADAHLDFDAIDIVDMLWLAQFIESATFLRATSKQHQKPIEIVDSNESSLNLYSDEQLQSQSGTSLEQKNEQKPEKAKGTPFSVPAAPALRTRRDLARSLRPLMRKVSSRTRFDLDEDATVMQIAETEVWMPVVRPRPERWLELDLVVEASKTTVIWERAIAEMNHLAEYQGAFRAVRTWHLSAQAGKVHLFPRWRDGVMPTLSKTELVSNQRPHTPRELIDPTGRRLIWLVTDCTSLLWRQDLIYEIMLDWAKAQPIAIVQMFPEPMWTRTALRNGHIVRLSALGPGLPSARLEIEGLPKRLEQRNSKDLVTVPIVTLDAVSMFHWARVASGYGDSHTPGRTFDLSFIRRQAERGESEAPQRLTPQRTAQERVALFRSTASKTVQKLADLMAAVSVSLPVIDLLRDAFRGDFEEEVQQSHVAEVLLSGLLRRADMEEEKACRYEFFGDDSTNTDERVRDILVGDASLSKTLEVLNILSESICRKLGSPSKSFQALLGELQASENSELRDAALPFARVGLDVLRRLGGEHAALARRYDLGGHGELESEDFPLQDLEYEVAKFFKPLEPDIEPDINFPELEVLTFTTARLVEDINRVIASVKKDRVITSVKKDRLYQSLEEYLQSKQWSKANDETLILMLRIADLDKQNYLRPEDISAFPDDDLKRIDKLWVHHSNGSYGFSVQVKIWLQFGCEPGQNDPEIFKRFAKKVGWYRDGHWQKHPFFNFNKYVSGHAPYFLGEWKDGKRKSRSGSMKVDYQIFRAKTVEQFERMSIRYISSLSKKLSDCNML